MQTREWFNVSAIYFNGRYHGVMCLGITRPRNMNLVTYMLFEIRALTNLQIYEAVYTLRILACNEGEFLQNEKQ